MTIKDEFLEEGGFAGFVEGLFDDGSMDVLSRHRYRHRLSVTGEELFYVRGGREVPLDRHVSPRPAYL